MNKTVRFLQREAAPNRTAFVLRRIAQNAILPARTFVATGGQV